MATGKEHSAATIGCAFGAGTAMIVTGVPAEITVPLIAGVLSGIFISPDMDVDDGNISYMYMRNVGMEWYWSFLWRPYALVMHHRGWSHFPIFSTIYRLIYLCFPVTILLSAFGGKRVAFFPTLLAQLTAIPFLSLFIFLGFYYPDLLIWATCGLIAADLLHLLFDI
jgi:uncharacterized metal-binding protein